MPYYGKIINGRCIEKICSKRKPNGQEWIKLEKPEEYEVCPVERRKIIDYIKDKKYEEIFTSKYGAIIIELIRNRDINGLKNIKINGINDLITDLQGEKI